MSGHGFIRLARVLPGAKPFKDRNINDTFKGQILTDVGEVRSAIIKDVRARELANELFVASLAAFAGLPVPNAFLGLVEAAEIAVNKGPELTSGGRLVFASEDAQTPPLAQLYLGRDQLTARRVVEKLAEWSGLGDLYALDAWVANVDRHQRNLLFSGEDRVWLIDHGHCFSGPRWRAEKLDANVAYRHKLGAWLTPALTEQKRNALADKSANFPIHFADADVAEIGRAAHVIELLGQSDFEALVAFLSERERHVPRLAAAALNCARLA
jgi:HipA-like kinase